MKGRCGAVKVHLQRNPFNITIGNNTQTECCDGTCCAEHTTECDTCEQQSCSTDSNGHQTCSTSYVQCNCRTYCSRHSTRGGSINCGTCHDYEAGFTFTLHGERHYKMKYMQCGLDAASGLDNHICQKNTLAAHAPGEVHKCWVHEETLEVYWEEPTWNIGCWVGVGIGGLLLLPCAAAAVLGALVSLAWLLRGSLQACHHAIDDTCFDRGPAAGCPPVASPGVKPEPTSGKIQQSLEQCACAAHTGIIPGGSGELAPKLMEIDLTHVL